MFKGKTEVLFPVHLIAVLGQLRSQTWQELVAGVVDQPPESPEQLAFVLMMVRLGGCTTCHADSYWAMQGCRKCSLNTINRFRGSDEDLVAKYTTALQEIRDYFEKGTVAEPGGRKPRSKGKIR